jgi:hypothetical protein
MAAAISCRCPFEKTQFLPDRDVTPHPVSSLTCPQTASQTSAGWEDGGQGPKPACRRAKRGP